MYLKINFKNLQSESEVAQLCPTLCDPWTVVHQAPPSIGFSRLEYWSGLPFSSPGGLPDPGIEPRSPTLQADALTSAPPGKPQERGVRVKSSKSSVAMPPGIWEWRWSMLLANYFCLTAN